MSCNNCYSNHPDESCPNTLTFVLDGSYLVPRCGATPLMPIDLAPVVTEAETDTRLQLDVSNRSLVYTGEHAANDIGSPDTITLFSIASLIDLNELRNVGEGIAANGDVLSYNIVTGLWEPYTVPTGTIVTPVGVSADGSLVKDGTGDTPQAPDTVPLGGIIIWPGDVVDIPVSYRQCNGDAISRGVYADLFDLIGTKYGAGDGSTSFNLPNLSTRVVAGLSADDTQFNTIGQTGGAKTHTLSGGEMPTHNHTAATSSAGEHQHTYVRGSYTNMRVYNGSDADRTMIQSEYVELTPGNQGHHSHGITVGNAGSSQPHNNLQPYMVMPYVMRVV